MKSITMYGCNSENLTYNQLVDMQAIGHFKNIDAIMEMVKSYNIHANSDSRMIIFYAKDIYEKVKNIDINTLLNELNKIHKCNIDDYKYAYKPITDAFEQINVFIDYNDKLTHEQLIYCSSFIKIIQMNKDFEYIILLSQD